PGFLRFRPNLCTAMEGRRNLSEISKLSALRGPPGTGLPRMVIAVPAPRSRGFGSETNKRGTVMCGGHGKYPMDLLQNVIRACARDTAGVQDRSLACQNLPRGGMRFWRCAAKQLM